MKSYKPEDICPFHNIPYEFCADGREAKETTLTQKGLQYWRELDDKADRTPKEEEDWRLIRQVIEYGEIEGSGEIEQFCDLPEAEYHRMRQEGRTRCM